MKLYLITIAVAALCVACGGEADTETAPELTGPFVLHSDCGMAFEPDPELLTATDSAAERWSTATGCNVRVEPGGFRIELWPSMRGTFDENGVLVSVHPTEGTKRMCGATDTVQRWSAVAPCSRSIELSVAHEMGHALGPATHSLTGLMAEDASGGIDSASLALVCEVFPCAAFRPEVDS